MCQQTFPFLALLILGTALVYPTLGLIRARTGICLSLFDYASTSQDVKACLGLGDDLPILMLFETDVFLSNILMLFGLVDGFGIVGSLLEAFSIDQTRHFLPALSREVCLSAAIKLVCITAFRRMVVIGDIGSPSAMVIFFILYSRRDTTCKLAFLPQMTVRNRFAQKIIFSQTIKVGMSECLRSRETISWGHSQQLLEEVECLGREFADIFLIQGVKVVNLGEPHAEKAWVLAEGFLMIRSEFSKCFLDEVKLVEFILSWEERISIHQLRHDASSSPQIHFSPIVHAHQQFWRTVPSRRNIISQFLITPGRLPCEAKVADLQLLTITNQQVLGLDVSVQQVVGMHVRQSLQQLVEEEPDQLGIEAPRTALQDFQQVVLDELEDKVDYAFLAEGLAKFDHVGVLEHFEDFDFSGSGLADSFVLLGLLKLLDGEYFLRVVGSTLEDYSVCALADYPQNLIFLHAALQTTYLPYHSTHYSHLDYPHEQKLFLLRSIGWRELDRQKEIKEEQMAIFQCK